MNERAVIYARFSRESQREESIDAQVRACREYCRKKGYIIVKIYKDEAKSGTTIAKRDNYKAMLADARQNIYDVIIFHKLDRNARNEYDYYNFKRKILSLGLRYEYAAQSIDSSAEGQLMENNLVGFAAYYSRNLANETKKGQRENALKAMFPGGTPPLGYKVVNQKYVIDEEEAPIVRMIFNLYLQGYGYHKITNVLEAHGYKTKVGKSFGRNSLYSIINNPRYCGTYTFGKVKTRYDGRRNSHSTANDMIVIKDAIPAIISKSEYARVLDIIAKNKRRPGRNKAKEPYILSGLVRCSCGKAACGTSATAHGHRYVYYQCIDQHSKSDNKCQVPKIPKHDLEDLVTNAVLKNVLTKNVAEIITAATSKYQEAAKTEPKQLNSLIAQRNGIEKRLNALYSILEGGMADEYDLKRLSDVKAELTSVKVKIDDIQAEPEITINPEYVQKMFDKYVSILKNKKSLEEIQALMQRIIRTVTISADYVDIDVNNYCVYDGAVGGT